MKFDIYYLYINELMYSPGQPSHTDGNQLPIPRINGGKTTAKQRRFVVHRSRERRKGLYRKGRRDEWLYRKRRRRKQKRIKLRERKRERGLYRKGKRTVR